MKIRPQRGNDRQPSSPERRREIATVSANPHCERDKRFTREEQEMANTGKKAVVKALCAVKITQFLTAHGSVDKKNNSNVRITSQAA